MADIQTCAVKAIIHSSNDGPPVAGAQIQVQLSYFDIYEGFVSPPPIRGVTDVNGECVFDLFPNELGQAASYYKVTITAEGKTFRSIAVVPNLPTALLHEITSMPAYDGKPDGYIVLARLEEMYTYIAAVTPKFLPNAPTNPLPGSRWTDADTGKTYEWVVTASSSAWFEVGSAETIGYETAIQAAQSAEDAAASAVDAQAAEDAAKSTLAVFAAVPPASPLSGRRWTSSDTGKTYEWIVDADGAQWVEVGPAQSLASNAVMAALALPGGSAGIGHTSSLPGAVTRTEQQKLRDYVTILDFGGVWDGTGDVSSVAQAALNSGAKVVDFLNLPGRVVSSVVVPTGIEARNINFIAGTPGMDVLRPNTKSIITGRVTGSGTDGSIVERAVSPATDGVNDVRLDLDISNLTVGVQIWPLGLTVFPRRWSGELRFSGLKGGGVNSNGYGLLIAGGHDCNFKVFSVDTPRHCVYISNGSKRNKVVLQSSGNGGAPVQLASFATQDYCEGNAVDATITGMKATSSSSAYGANVVGKCRHNQITVSVDDSAVAQGALLFRANDADTVPYRNVGVVFHKDGYSGPTGVVRSDSGYENRVSVFGEGLALAGSGTAVVSAGVYSGITPNGIYDCALHIDAYSWDCKGGAMRGAAALAAYAPVNIGQGVMRGHKNSTLPKVYLSGGGTVIGYTHKDVFRQGSTAIAAGATLDIVRTYAIPFDNFAFSTVKVIAPSATPTTMPSYVATSDALVSNTVKIKNGDASNSQNFLVIFDTEGY